MVWADLIVSGGRLPRDAPAAWGGDQVCQRRQVCGATRPRTMSSGAMMLVAFLIERRRDNALNHGDKEQNGRDRFHGARKIRTATRSTSVLPQKNFYRQIGIAFFSLSINSTSVGRVSSPNRTEQDVEQD